MITSIADSRDLASLLNTAIPATPEDAAENPTDWLDGLCLFGGDTYDVDAENTTTTRLVLADGTAAVSWSPQGTYCGNSGEHRTCVEAQAGHWCPADRSEWTDNDVRGVVRDWRTVCVWDSNGYSQTDTYPTLDEAIATFRREVDEMCVMSEDLDRQEADSV
ncbi:hypothetical protein [Streptomyces sp. NPDC012888]|uniref:hypothetical protein n=1 Tax=Streptomyces sp. NPDC012888 TaxID=3364855 RepID=UPI00368ECC20